MGLLEKQELSALYGHIHRLTVQKAGFSSCTLEQVAEVLQKFGYERFTRAEIALCLYWRLAENQLDQSPCQSFLAALQQVAQRDRERRAGETEEQTPSSSLRTYWTGEREHPPSP
jgi:hypothetical protein